MSGAAHVAAAVSGAPRSAALRPLLRGTRRSVVRWTAAGLPRELIEVAPASSYRSLPLVVVLHGRRQTPWLAERIERWDALAATGRAVIVYGAGYAGSWNAGRCCGQAAAHRVNDEAYLLRVLRVEGSRNRLDRRRIYLVGFSNGGMLAYRFACSHSTSISGFAVVGGAQETPSCRPARSLAVLDVEGDHDRVVPYGGARFSRVAGSSTTSVAHSLRPWRVAAVRADEVQLVRLPGVGHVWPTRQLGWDATSRIWQFLARHPTATSSYGPSLNAP